MSFFSKAFPWLFDEIPEQQHIWQERIAQASPAEKHSFASSRKTPPRALATLARDPQAEIREILTKRLAEILPTLSATEQVELYDLTVDAIRHLAEDQVTAVRVALASALKDVAKTPHEIARKLADDAERAVAEPILRYSLALSDQDLLELIAQHPQDWHPVTIAQRRRLTTQITDAIAQTENMEASRTLLRNDSAPLSAATQQRFGRNKDLQNDMKARQSFTRKMRQDWHKMTDQVLYNFLREQTNFDQVMTTDVINKVHQNMDSQDNLRDKPPGDWNEEEIADAVKMGENNLAVEALAIRAKIPVTKVRRMLDADNARAVIALCVRADMPMSFATIAQSKLARLAPNKMLYPKQGDQCPMTQEELQWQWDFFAL